MRPSGDASAKGPFGIIQRFLEFSWIQTLLDVLRIPPGFEVLNVLAFCAGRDCNARSLGTKHHAS